MIGICLSSVSAVPAGDPAWNPSSPPLKFRTASFPSATSSKGLLRETLTGEYRSSYATQRVPKGLSGFDDSLAGLVQFAQRVVRRVFVDVAQGRIVEDRMDEEVNVAAEAQAGQSDVNQFAGELADDVHAQALAAGDLEDHFDHPLGVTDDLATAMVAVFVLADDGAGAQISIHLCDASTDDLRDVSE